MNCWSASPPVGGVTLEVMRRRQRACSAGERGGISSSAMRLSSVATSRPRHSSKGRPEPSAAMTGASSPRSTAKLLRSTKRGVSLAGGCWAERLGAFLRPAVIRGAQRIEGVPFLGRGTAGGEEECESRYRYRSEGWLTHGFRSLGSDFYAWNRLGDRTRIGLEFVGKNVQGTRDDGANGANDHKKPEQARHFAIPPLGLSLFPVWRHYDLHSATIQSSARVAGPF